MNHVFADGTGLVGNVGGAASIGINLLGSPLLRHWYNRWGATREEERRPLPGDELVPNPRLKYTLAITIEAAPARIWPWLLQIGQGKAVCTAMNGLKIWRAATCTTLIA